MKSFSYKLNLNNFFKMMRCKKMKWFLQSSSLKTINYPIFNYEIFHLQVIFTLKKKKKKNKIKLKIKIIKIKKITVLVTVIEEILKRNPNKKKRKNIYIPNQ